MFASAASGLRAFQRCARGVQWCQHQEGAYQWSRFLSACPISCSSSKDDSASDGGDSSSSAAKGGGDSGNSSSGPAQIVDPAKDASLQDLFVIPIKKPLIPGAALTYRLCCCFTPSWWLTRSHHSLICTSHSLLHRAAPPAPGLRPTCELFLAFCGLKLL